MFVFILDYLVPLNQVDSYLEAHRQFLDVHYRNGKLLASGPRPDRVGGVILSMATSMKEAQEIMKSDPFYVHNVAKYTIFEFDATKTLFKF
mgnify:FL=1